MALKALFREQYTQSSPPALGAHDVLANCQLPEPTLLHMVRRVTFDGLGTIRGPTNQAPARQCHKAACPLSSGCAARNHPRGYQFGRGVYFVLGHVAFQGREHAFVAVKLEGRKLDGNAARNWLGLVNYAWAAVVEHPVNRPEYTFQSALNPSVIERRKQLQRIGLRLIMIDKQLCLVGRHHSPHLLHGRDRRRFVRVQGRHDISSGNSLLNEPRHQKE